MVKKIKLKKAEANLFVVIALVIFGIFFAREVGLFSVFTPSIGQPSGTDSLVNPVYYDAITYDSSICQTLQRVTERISVETASPWDCPKYLARDTNSDGLLEPYVYYSYYQFTPPSDAVLYGPRNCYYKPTSESNIDTSIYSNPNDLFIETLGGTIPSEDAGKYFCESNSITLCSDSGKQIIQSCANQQCQFLNTFQTPDGIKPVVKCSGNYKSNQNLCVGNTRYSTTDGNSISLEVCGNSCVGGQCIECIDGQKRCKQKIETSTDIEICQAGKWVQFDGIGSTCSGESSCVEQDNNAYCESSFSNNQERCNLKQPQTFSTSTNTWTNKGESCDIECYIENNEAKCRKECIDIGYTCEQGVLTSCSDEDIDNELTTIGACISGQCSDDKCLPKRQVGTKYCSSGDLYLVKTTGNNYDLFGGSKGELLSECQYGCEEISSTDARCKESECSGEKVCLNGQIRSCNNGVISSVVDDCSGLGCSENFGDPICNDGCSNLGEYKCSNGDSFVCELESSQKKWTLNQECGIEGCSNGLCESTGTPNSYVCIGEALHSTDQNGFISTNPIKICSAEPEVNGLQPYCSEGSSDCKICEVNQYICNDNELYQCANSLGEKKNVQSCLAGCEGLICDQPTITISQTQNFFSDEQVIIKGKVTGSKSGKPISTSYSATLGTQTKQGVTDSSGNLNINFGVKSLGDYSVNIVFNEFNKEKIVNVKVTNDYIIKIFGEPVTSNIPGEITKVEVEAKDKNGNQPDDIIVSSSEIDAVTEKTVSNRWDIILDGDPGIYTIGLKAVKDSISLDEQLIEIEIRQPLLEIKTNLPESSKVGTKDYDITILGNSQNIKPDSLTATINSNQITLSEIGVGKYTFSYDFGTEGTYTLTIEAEKEGYESTPFSQLIQISKSGEDLPPGSSVLEQDTPSISNIGNNYNLIILIVLGILGYIIFRGKKK